MALTYIKIFLDSLEALEPLSFEERGRLFTALLEYAKTGKPQELPGNERFLFPMFRGQLDREASNYETACETRRANGAQGGRPRKKPDGFSETEKSQDKDKEKEEEKDKDKDKDSSSGASRPGQRRASFKGRAPARRRDDTEEVRENLARMDRLLLEIRRQAAEAEAEEASR